MPEAIRFYQVTRASVQRDPTLGPYVSAMLRLLVWEARKLRLMVEAPGQESPRYLAWSLHYAGACERRGHHRSVVNLDRLRAGRSTLH